ncbi:MAG TPA: class I SAM-dependent rRNA methyltransferase, partial [Vicinamibacteria bacterium]|nr:class I SAM-dependent rRNA methyltransferase [Vicinamibacteria bacterium]
GLVVDRYGEYLVVQTLAQGTERLKDEIVGLLVDLLHPRGVLERNDLRVRLLEGLDQRVSPLHGEVPPTIEVEEGGIVYEVDLWKGQKTGLFLDQRENHRAAASYARGRVLDGFSYNGGFGLQAAGKAAEVVCVDTSDEAVLRAERNAARNGLANVRAVGANVFDFLRESEARHERFDTIILDPPAFAKSKSAIPGARRGYKDINLRALRLLAPGGTLITCSCSYHVHEADFEAILEEAAVDAGVAAAILEKRRQARDHPVALGVPETSYLKCFILRRLS